MASPNSSGNAPCVTIRWRARWPSTHAFQRVNEPHVQWARHMWVLVLAHLGVRSPSFFLTTLSFPKSVALQDWRLSLGEIILSVAGSPFKELDCGIRDSELRQNLAHDLFRSLFQPLQRPRLQTFAPQNSPSRTTTLGFWAVAMSHNFHGQRTCCDRGGLF